MNVVCDVRWLMMVLMRRCDVGCFVVLCSAHDDDDEDVWTD